MEYHNLKLEERGYYTGYDMEVDPTMSNAVASTALHFSISLMPTLLKIYDKVIFFFPLVYFKALNRYFLPTNIKSI